MKTGRIIPNYKYFESQEADESVIFVIRRHWLFLVTPFLLGGLLLILEILGVVFGGPYVANNFPGITQAIFICIFSLAILFTTLFVFMNWLIRYLSIIILTTEHLVEIEQSAVFSRKVSELDLDCVEDATSDQKGFWATMFHFGDVLIQTAGELPNFHFLNVEDPSGVQQKIMEAKEVFMKSRLVVENTSVPPVTPPTVSNVDPNQNLNEPPNGSI